MFYCICLFIVPLCVGARAIIHPEVIGQCGEVSTASIMWIPKLELWAWWEVPLPTASSHWP